MLEPPSLAALVDIDAAAEALGVGPALARAYLVAAGDAPIATYQGRELWLSDTVHDALEEGDVAVRAERAAREAFDHADAQLHGGVES